MKIMIAYDGSQSADAAIYELSRAGLPAEAEALIVSVADDRFHALQTSGGSRHESPSTWRTRLEEANALGSQAAVRLQSLFPTWKVSSEGLWGSAAKVILDACERWHPDLLVAGPHGHSAIGRLFLGSVCVELVHKAPCSVRIARPVVASDADIPIRIIVATDGSKEAEAVVRAVSARCWPAKTEAQVISVVQPLVPVISVLEANTLAQEPAYSVIREADERMRFRLNSVATNSANALRRAGLPATSEVMDGDPREAILAFADLVIADTIFVGARGLGRMDRLLLGSVSSYIVTHARCTVEVVRDYAIKQEQLQAKPTLAVCV